MIPLGDVIPSRTTPYVSLAIIAVSVATALLQPGVAFAPILANTLALWIFGRTVEDRMDHARLAAFAVLCGIAAVAAHRDATTAIILTGMAGGVLGAYFFLFPRSLVLMLVPAIPFVQIIELPALLFLALWVLVQALVVQDWLSAATGLAAGLAGAAVFRRPERMRVEWWSGPT